MFELRFSSKNGRYHRRTRSRFGGRNCLIAPSLRNFLIGGHISGHNGSTDPFSGKKSHPGWVGERRPDPDSALLTVHLNAEENSIEPQQMRNLVLSAVLFDAFQLELISRGRFGVIFNILRLILLVMLARMSRTVLFVFTYIFTF